MNITITARFVLLACLSLYGAAPIFAAKGGKGPAKPGGPPKAVTPAAPVTPPAPVLPSAQLRRLIDNTLPDIENLEGANKTNNRTALVEAQAEFTAKVTTGDAADRKMYEASVGVVNALIGAVDEHDKAMTDYHYSKSVHGPQDTKDMDISNTHKGIGSGKTAKANNAKEKKENKESTKELQAKEAMLGKGAIEAWKTRAGQLRAAVEQTYASELVIEKQTVAARPPAETAPTTAADEPAPPTPPTKPKPTKKGNGAK